MLINHGNEEKKQMPIPQQLDQLNSLDDDLVSMNFNSENFGEFEQFEFRAEPQVKEHLINLEIKFFVECIVLALLDLDGKY
jgi:hypothetical protein